MGRNHANEPQLFSNLLIKLPELRNLGAKHTAHLDWFRLNWSKLTLPPLFAEIFDIPKCEDDLQWGSSTVDVYRRLTWAFCICIIPTHASSCSKNLVTNKETFIYNYVSGTRCRMQQVQEKKVEPNLFLGDYKKRGGKTRHEDVKHYISYHTHTHKSLLETKWRTKW